MRGSKAKKLRKFFPHSADKPIWRKYKRLMNGKGKSQDSTYKGPGVPSARGTWGPSDEIASAEQIQRYHYILVTELGVAHKVRRNTALIDLHPTYVIGKIFADLNKKGKMQALLIGVLAERVSKPVLLYMIHELKNNKEYFEPDRDETQQSERPDRIGQDPLAPVA